MVSEKVFRRSANLTEGKADMNGDGKSDSFVVPSTHANNVATATEEFDEGRRLPKESGIAVADVPDTVPDRHRLAAHCPRQVAGFAGDRLIQHRPPNQLYSPPNLRLPNQPCGQRVAPKISGDGVVRWRVDTALLASRFFSEKKALLKGGHFIDAFGEK